jgi:hypothetical protein
MPYDQQGNFYGSDEDLGDLKAKYVKPNPASQIPDQVSSSKPEESKSLRDRAVAALMQYNPLMVMKSLKEASGAVALGSILPVAAPLSAGVQALNAAPGNAYRRSIGEKEVETPSANELMQKYGEAIYPKTELGQDMVGGVSKLIDTLKVPAAWPMVPNAPRRPVLTPTDVRVGAGQVRQLAKELREAPTDFQAAQSGLKRQNLYGEDTLGVKAQAAADALGDTLERRNSAGLSTLPGIPQALTPETKLYAVRPKGTRIVQAKVPATAKGFNPDNNMIGDLVEDIYDDVPSNEMPPALIMQKYREKYISENDPFRSLLREAESKKAREMFPDAPSSGDAQRAYDVLHSNQSKRNEMQLQTIEEVLNSPEGARFREQGVPTPKEFMTRMSEAERVLKGPFTNFISKNVGAEGDPMVSLARQGITYESPEKIKDLSQFTNASMLADRRLAGGFPAMGSFMEERMAKTGELDRLNEEIQNIEAIREPLFNRAHEQGIDPASIPEYAETTNPLRQKLREREKLQGDLENIKLATAMENLGDTVVVPKTKQRMLSDIPYEQRQFFPSVTKAADDEKLFAATTKSLLNDMGYKKLGEDLLSDILEGKAGDTSKLTIENFIRDKHLSRVEAEKAAKLQQQQYRTALETALTDRLKNDQNVQTFGNAAIITLDKNTPKDVAIRDVSADTTILDHCVGQCGTAPKGRKNILTNQQQYYEPVVDPITGARNRSEEGRGSTSYVEDLERGHELVSVRDVKTGFPAATIQLTPTSNGMFNIGFASGAKNGAVDPAYVGAIRDYLNFRAASISSPGINLADNVGIFDSRNPSDWKRVTKEAKLSKDQAAALEAETDRFVTVDDVKEMSKKYPIQEPSPSGEPSSTELGDWEADPTAVANAPRVFELAGRYNLPPSVIREMQSRFADPTMTVANLSMMRDYARAGGVGTIFENLPVESRDGAARMITEEIAQRRLEAPPQPAQGFTPEQLRLFARGLIEMDREADGTLRQTGIDSTAYALQMGQLDSTTFNNIPAGPERARAMEPILRAFVEEVAAERQQAPPQPAQPTDERVRELAARYEVPPGMVRDILTEMNGPPARMVELQNQAANARGRFENLLERSRDGVIFMIDDLLAERNQAPAQPQNQIAVRTPVPREIQVMAPQDLIAQMEPRGIRQARELAGLYFNENLIDDNNTTISALTNMIRNYRVGPHADANFDVREMAARELEALHNDAIRDADQIADTLREVMYEDMEGPEEAMHAISRDISILQRRGEAAWEDVIGPLAEDIPWSRNVQARVIENLRAIANQYRRQLDEEGPPFARGGPVKKARTPSVVNMRYPELAEMQYRYGGMV